MRLTILLLSLIIGLFMFTDGVYVLLNHKYIGPEKPGPWAELFYRLHIDVFRLGALFIAFGLLWLVFLSGFTLKKRWAAPMGVVIATATLWYLPVGTLISLMVLALLWRYRKKHAV